MGVQERRTPNTYREFERDGVPLKRLLPPFKGKNTKVGVLEGRSSSKEITSPFPLIRGRGIKGDRVTK